MHFNWNNRFGGVLASSVAILFATAAYAIPKGPCDTPPDQTCCDEVKPGPYAFAYPMDMNLACPRDFYVYIDGLAFQAKEDGLDFAIRDGNGPQTVPLTNGDVLGFSNDHSDYEWNPGMRIGLGFYLNHDQWCLDFGWTWVNVTNYQSHGPGSDGGGIIPLWFIPGHGFPLNQGGQSVGAKWDVRYNTFDIRLGKPYHISRFLEFHPHFGLRGACIDQHFSVHYSNMGGNLTSLIHHSDNDFYGFGSRAGLDTTWSLGKGWSLFGNIAASLLFGKFEIDQHLSQLAFAASPDGFEIDKDYYQNVSNMEIALGISWGTYFNKQKHHIALKAAYEFHEWWDQLNIVKFYGTGPSYANDTVSRGNYTMNGFSLRLELNI